MQGGAAGPAPGPKPGGTYGTTSVQAAAPACARARPIGALLTLGAAPAFAARYAVFAVNDLGMHCYQRSYAGFMILPPANNLKVQIFRKETTRISSPAACA